MGSFRKAIFFCGMLLMMTASQTVSLQDILKQNQQQKQNLVPNCSFWNNGQCLTCQQGYELQQGKCIKISEQPQPSGQNISDEGQSVDDNFVPCSGKSNCAESQGFQNQDDYNKFISQFQQQPQPVQRLISPPQNTRLAPSLEFQSAQSFAFKSAPQQTLVQPTVQPTAQPSADRDFSGTNNQQENVDEADILKTDGTYIYTISGKTLSIVQAYPLRQIKLLSSVQLTGFNPTALFIEGNYLTVFGSQYANYYGAKSAYVPYVSTTTTIIKIFNIKNRANPYIIKNYEIIGNYFNGRKTDDGYVYLLTTHRLYSSGPLPWYNFNARQQSFPFRSIFYYPGSYRNPLFVTITTFNLRNPYTNDRNTACIITENANNIYMSERAIYITYTDYSKGGDNSVIHKVYVRKSSIIPFADARVKGSINNQFSMDEYRQVLRVATTSNSQVGRTFQTSSNVFCLDYFLTKIGQLNGIAPTERIFSARYVDRKLYLVTFRQVDPFFVISLQNHRAPKILGELKITGFSRYLHPYDEDTIIGLGRQADANGRQLGLKISLFDVSNVASPQEISSFELEEKYASSAAEWEHKAFLFSRTKNLMAIPASMNYNNVKFNGAFVFYIDRSIIKLRGIIDHLLSNTDNFYQRNVDRSLYIEQLLYTKSKCLLRVNRIFDLEGVKDVTLPCQNQEIIQYPIPIRMDPIRTGLPVLTLNNRV